MGIQVISRRVELLFVLFFVSGMGGLIYESVWSHYVKLFLGHAAYAQTLVLVVFIGGLALGAWLCARMAERLRNPLRAYGIVEAATGILALVFHAIFVMATDWGYAVLLPAACEQANAFCPAQWLLAALLLLPQSVLLGMTFPLMSSAVLRLDTTQPGHHIAALYFLNSFGAVLGVLASAFILIPRMGLPGTLMAAGVANIVIGIAAFLLSRSPPAALVVAPLESGRGGEEARGRRLVSILLLTAFLTGLSSFIYEIAWIRMLSLVLGGTTHAFEVMLASFILGLAAGGLWIRRRIDTIGDPVRYLAVVQLAMGIAAAATIPVYGGSFDVMAWILAAISRSGGGYLIYNVSSTLLALLVMLPATFCAGMTLPLITYRLLRSPSGERSLGMVYAVNTVGAIVGVLIAVHLLLEWIGVGGAVIVGAAIDVGLGAALLLAGPRATARRKVPLEAIAAVLLLAVIAVVFQVDPRRTSAGVFRTGIATLGTNDKIAFHRDGKTATVDVVESQGVRSIRTNGKADASLAIVQGRQAMPDEFTMSLLAILPMGHAPQAKSAAVIGFGSGMTSALLLTSPTLERLDTIEIEPAMVEGARLFGPPVAAAFEDKRSRIVIDDAKSYFARGRNRYDIIVSEPSNPWVSGVASLFTEEFYERLAQYLNDGGVLSQWLHTYEMDAATLASIFAAVEKTFPDFAIYSTIDTDIVLIARKGGAPGAFDGKVLANPAIGPMLQRLKLTDVEVVRRRAIGNWSLVRPLFASFGSPPNSDFYPVVDHWASRTRFTQARVRELMDLQGSQVPLLEMLGRQAAPSPRRFETIPSTFLESATEQAWWIHDIFSGVARQSAPGLHDIRDLSAHLVKMWSTSCPADMAFDEVLPSMVSVAQDVNPRLPPAMALQIWRGVAASACARKLDANQRRWIELFEASARRDAELMATHALALLGARQGLRTAESEYAFFAAVTALACRGEIERARSVLRLGASHWVRPRTRTTELRFLEASLALKSVPPPRTCVPALA